MARIVQAAGQIEATVDVKKVCDRILSSIPGINITGVQLVENHEFRYIYAAYQLRKAQFELSRRHQCPTEDLYHATAEKNVESILKNNLNWRKVMRAKYGKGVSFSDSPWYANKYCNNKNGSKRAFILCEVLTGNGLRVISNSSSYPKYGKDTYRSKNNLVVVKFEDDSFFPKCVIYYQTSSPGPSPSLNISQSGDKSCANQTYVSNQGGLETKLTQLFNDWGVRLNLVILLLSFDASINDKWSFLHGLFMLFLQVRHDGILMMMLLLGIILIGRIFQDNWMLSLALLITYLGLLRPCHLKRVCNLLNILIFLFCSVTKNKWWIFLGCFMAYLNFFYVPEPQKCSVAVNKIKQNRKRSK